MGFVAWGMGTDGREDILCDIEILYLTVHIGNDYF